MLTSVVTVSRDADADGAWSASHWARISYRYEVGGKQRVGDRRSYADYTSGSSSRARRIAEEYTDREAR